ncbi:collagenase-like protease [Desulfocapsa sulfexigens DSM 10523]|uniref:Collagenase-like protease n=1 Tax=Desulfocapsa sulfexigens (strain DSM 10523 / SB164P1) TaxID=1167006 RepID=M1PKE9_DESSD|nr:U32 family peptidase [Desulfocapsa sulfexigens]AGF76966.1 collagenase-like protease [Desulfocapsa sulfexigens DSM 10523]
MDKKESNKAGIPVIPELLAPAGNFEKMVTAIHYGADAVYMGGKQFSLRAKAGNFSDEKMAEAVQYAHAHDVKIYVTINILAHNRDFTELDNYLSGLRKAGVDGLIIADPGILRRARECVPEIPVHLSTQANVTNAEAAEFWFEQGVSRLNLARELSLKEIREVRQQTQGELEIFVHGALCISYSGRCMLSNYMTGRDANQGACAHPCRYSYKLIEEKRPGEYFPVEEDERGTYIFNSKDLCLLEGLPELVASGANSLKIEGRMKSIFYVGGVTRIYRAALDYLRDLPPEAWDNPSEIRLPSIVFEEIAKTGTRGTSENFFRHVPGSSEMLYTSPRVQMEVEPVAVIRGEGEAPLVEARNVLETGNQVEYMLPGISCIPLTVVRMETEKGEVISRANPGNRLFLHTEPPLTQGRMNGIIRRSRKDSFIT